MARSREETLEQLARLIIAGDDKLIIQATSDALASGISPTDILDNALTKGLTEVGDRFARLEIYLPEMIQSAEAMQSALGVLEPELKSEVAGGEPMATQRGKVVIGTIQGDIHDLGKNIVATMLSVSGFEVIDVGRDVKPDRFIEAAQRTNADIIAVSALLTTTMPYVKDLIRDLADLGVRDAYKVMVGGGPVTLEWAESVGADGYGDTAAEAVSLARELLAKSDGGDR